MSKEKKYLIFQTKGIMAQQVLLANSTGLIDTDLGQAYGAVRSGRDVAAGMTVR